MTDSAGSISPDRPDDENDEYVGKTTVKGVSRLSRVLSGSKVIWLLAAVAVVFLTAGIVVSQFIQSPADAAAKVAAPEAGLITVPVEQRVIANDVTLRADVLYDESVEVKLDTAEIAGTAVVTGRVPEVGTTLDPGSIILEIAGRPVIALPGELPAYRSLRVGVAGPDVLQLKATLASMGFNPGNVESDRYDAATAAAVDQLYLAVGYPSPPASAEDLAAVDSARAMLTTAKDSLATAELALTQAASGPSQVERMTQDSAVASAERALNTARDARDNPPLDPETGQPMTTQSPTELQAAVDDAQDAYNIAVATRDEVLAGTGTAAEKQARDSARQAVTDAQTELTAAQERVLTSLPSGEIVYFSNLPRRVDQVSVTRGQTIAAATSFMSVSGASVIIKGSVAPSDADLLSAGLAGTFALPDGSTGTATIADIKAAEKDDAAADETKTARFTVTFALDGLTDEQIAAVQGTNIKIVVPVNSTGDKVLAVPSAALTAGPGGESRIERTADGKTTELITVTTGLAASGFVQIVDSEKPLSENDLVVVGK